MIVGHGIDLQEISAIEKVYQRNPRFAQKILTEQELAILRVFLTNVDSAIWQDAGQVRKLLLRL